MSKVSVIMGVMNSNKKYLKNSINSIKEQTIANWEFIICDDGSKDDTYEFLLDNYGQDNRFKIIKNNENKGLAYTLNHCLEYATGDYIARMDDDDFSYPNRFKVQLEFLKKNSQVGFCSSAVDIYDGENTIKKDKKILLIPEAQDLLWGSRFVHPACMFRSEVLRKVGGYRVAKETTRAEDYDLFLRLYAQGIIGANIDEPLLRYFVNPDAMKKKRKYKFRIEEAVVRHKGFKNLGLYPKAIPYVIKPLLVGLIPKKILFKLQN